MDPVFQRLGDVTIQRLEKPKENKAGFPSDSLEKEKKDESPSPSPSPTVSTNFPTLPTLPPSEDVQGVKRNTEDLPGPSSKKSKPEEAEKKLPDELSGYSYSDAEMTDYDTPSDYESEGEAPPPSNIAKTKLPELEQDITNDNMNDNTNSNFEDESQEMPADFLNNLVEEPFEGQAEVKIEPVGRDEDYEYDIKEKLKEMGEISFETVKKGDNKPKKLEINETEVSVVPAKKTGEEESGSGERKGNMRRNIREVMDETKLDESTLSAQRQEAERLRRVQEQQRLIREVQRQMAQDRVISLLQGSNLPRPGTSASTKIGNTVLVKLPNGQTKPMTKLPKKPLELMRMAKGPMAPQAGRSIFPHKKPSMGQAHLTPSVSIAPVTNKRPPASMSRRPSESDSDNEDAMHRKHFYKPKPKEPPVATIEVSSDDDCIVVSESENDPGNDEAEDPTNSGMHTNDEFNQPDDQGRVVINIGHPEDETDIYLAPQISRIIKPHQIGGIRFLYDNIIESVKRFETSTGFGCILAHSMGLGKTLQVVTFSDIFLRHTPARTILCIMPINTLQNWLAEFNMWLPTEDAAGASPLLAHGEVRPRNFNLHVLNDSHKTLAARAKVIHEWKTAGGVLLIGYEQYRLLSLKKFPKSRSKKPEQRISDEDRNKILFEEVHEALVKPGPDLVICDEGHRIKNSHASISQALKQMRTKRRVVLTGYPLQNNLMEYWCMVDFVRPNYLGTKTEFCNMFERPIQNGQCIDSTEADIKLMRYRAHVLHSLLLGFVQRRSHRVLQTALPQKEEYVLLVRMTPFQRTLYETFMNEVVRTQTVPNPLKAFAVCCKIWNHPDVLYYFLKKQAKGCAVDIDLEEVSSSTASTEAPAKATKSRAKKPSRSKKPKASITPYNTDGNAETVLPPTANVPNPAAPSQNFTPQENSNSVPNPPKETIKKSEFETTQNNYSNFPANQPSYNSNNSSFAPQSTNYVQSNPNGTENQNFLNNFGTNSFENKTFQTVNQNVQYGNNSLQNVPTPIANSFPSTDNNMINNYQNQQPGNNNTQFRNNLQNFVNHEESSIGSSSEITFQNPPTPGFGSNSNFSTQVSTIPRGPESSGYGTNSQGSTFENTQISTFSNNTQTTFTNVSNYTNNSNSNYQNNQQTYPNNSQNTFENNSQNFNQQQNQNYWNTTEQKPENYYNNFNQQFNNQQVYQNNTPWIKKEDNKFLLSNSMQLPIKSENSNPETKPKINILSDIKITNIYDSKGNISPEKKINILSGIKIEPKKEELDLLNCKPELKPEFKNEFKGEPKIDLFNKSEVDEELKIVNEMSSSKGAPSLTKEDTGIPYDWAKELLKDYEPGHIENSAKMEILFCIIKESLALGDRLLVFSQSLITLDLIEQFLQMNIIPGDTQHWSKNTSYFRLDGSTSALEREKLINEFNSNPKVHLFLVSTRAGSLGINLIGANRVVVLDASWNPCHDTQAVCRVYRYGQKKPCYVYRLVVDNCLEKKIYDRQINKQGMSDRVVDECNPDAHLTIKDVSTLCWDDEKEVQERDFSHLRDNYSDLVLQKVLDQHGKRFNKEPFQHESLLIDRKDKQLSQQEKRLAKKGYEREKQATSRGPSYGVATMVRGHRPIASVRPMQQGGERPTRWIPAEHWQRQGMTAQEMTLPLDVVIPTNQPDKGNIVLKAGQKVLVLKSPKGVYMQLESGKIVAIKTAIKVRGKAEDDANKAKAVLPPAIKNNTAISVTPQKRSVKPFNSNVGKLNMRGVKQPVPNLSAHMHKVGRKDFVKGRQFQMGAEITKAMRVSSEIEVHPVNSSEDEKSSDRRPSFGFRGENQVNLSRPQAARSESDEGDIQRSEDDSMESNKSDMPTRAQTFKNFSKQKGSGRSALQQLEQSTSVIMSDSKQPFQETLDSITSSYSENKPLEQTSSADPVRESHSIAIEDDSPIEGEEPYTQVVPEQQHPPATDQPIKTEVPPQDYSYNNYYGYNHMQPYPPPPPQPYAAYPPQPAPYDINMYPPQQQPYNYGMYPPQGYPPPPPQGQYPPPPPQPYDYGPPPPGPPPPQPMYAGYPPYPPQQYPPPPPPQGVYPPNPPPPAPYPPDYQYPAPPPAYYPPQT